MNVQKTIGIDEVGRGALAGPAVVGAVSLDGIDRAFLAAELEAVLRRTIADSKKLTKLQRERAAAFLREHVAWSVGEASADEIDGYGIVGALRLASGRALAPHLPAERILADAGLRHPHEKTIATQWIVKGDETILEITCASIIAKVYRDALMARLAAEHAQYGWETNAGYGSASHMRAIREKGRSAEHRASFLTKE
jgi:ribonuclease HII